jgi:hypothetical protein
MVIKFRQTDEGFTWVFKAPTVPEQIKRLKEWAATNQALVPIVRLGVGAEKPDWNLPEGMPDITKLQEDIPDGMGQTSLQLEWRRIKGFIIPNSNMSKLSTVKREAQWVNILESVHHKEAKILTAVKDGTLLELYPELESLLPGLGITEYNKPETKKKSKTTKKLQLV